MKFFYENLETKEREEVLLEKWLWAVVYKDGSEFHQFEVELADPDNSVFHRVGEIKQEEVALFVMISADRTRRLDIVVPEGAKLVHKYKNYVFNTGTEMERRERIYMAGIKKDGHGVFNYILPNGTIVQSNNEDETISNFGI